MLRILDDTFSLESEKEIRCEMFFNWKLVLLACWNYSVAQEWFSFKEKNTAHKRQKNLTLLTTVTID